MRRFVYCLLLQCVLIVSGNAQEETPSISRDSALRIDLSSKPLVKDNKIVLQWTLRGFEKNGFCIVERSSDEKNYEVIGAIKAHTAQATFEFADERPGKEKNFYRIRVNGAEGKTSFSQTISADRHNILSCKFYPNPVDKLLIVRIDYTGELQITDALNKARISQQLQPGLQVVDVSSLDKGLYILTISRNNTNVVITEKLIKN